MSKSEIEEIPTLYGVPIKGISLVTLTVQNSALILLMHYSRVMDVSERYISSTAVLMNEIMKLCICLFLVVYTRGVNNLNIHSLTREIFSDDWWKLLIPAFLYSVQNNLQYVAVSNLSAAEFQVTYQLKILTTALCSVILLGRKLSWKKWIALFVLTAGVAIIQLPSGYSSPSHINDEMNKSLGLVAVIAACIISGMAGVYFEKCLKQSKADLWVRNIQLSFFSLFFAGGVGVFWVDGAIIKEVGFFFGYNKIVWTTIAFQAAGGLIVALCVNYADNIAKNFATSISIVLSFIASVYFFDYAITLSFSVGAAIVLYATHLYTQKDEHIQHKVEESAV